jgi:lipooligosaccharide transport system permease protein
MSQVFANWQGASKIVDSAKAQRWGAVYVGLARGRESFKWWAPMLAYGIGHPVLYLMSIGIGLGLQGFEWEKGFYAMNQTSVASKQIATGLMLYAAFRVLMNSIIYAVILALFGALSWDAIPGQLAIALFLGISFGFVMLTYSSFIAGEGDWLVLAMRFIIAPMFMFSGTFYQLENMPVLVQNLAWFSPLWHGTELARSLSYGSSDPYTLWHILILTAIGTAAALVVYPQFVRRLAK